MAQNGEYNYKTAQVLSQLADAESRENELTDEAISHYEKACMILTKLEGDEQKKRISAKNPEENPELSKTYLKLDRIYLKLVDLYLETN